MRPPRRPPAFEPLLERAQRAGRLAKVLSERSAARGLADGKYLHWDELRHRAPPGELTHEEWWLALKIARRALRRELPLDDSAGVPFVYATVDPIPERLHEFDRGAGGLRELPEPLTNRQTKDSYRFASLASEAITSSQIEGATTTRAVAREMIRTGRRPRDQSERMIMNNFMTMQKLREVKDQDLTPEMVLDLHRMITADTLADPGSAGRLRRADETVVVEDAYGEVLREPPSARLLGRRMERMCAFGNGELPDRFVHPVIRAIVLHFWLAYDHPFLDGNGRTARALFYWSMLRSGFWLFEFVSISEIILSAPIGYGKAFLHTESDDNDLTYFLLHHLEVVRRGVIALERYVDRKATELEQLQAEMQGLELLNIRQQQLLGHALENPHHVYTIEGHRKDHDVAYETARSDLLALADLGLLKKRRSGKKWVFRPEDGLHERLRAL